MLRDFLKYLNALWREWRLLLTGGSIIAVLAIWSFATGKPIPQKFAWLILGVTFIVASFMTWRREASRREGRVYVEDPANTLCSLYVEHTEITADRLARPYLGKWLRAFGEICDVSTTIYGKYWVYVTTEDRPSFHLEFDNEWMDQVAILRKGQQIAVAGQIAAITSGSISLRHCEPVSGYTLTPTRPEGRPAPSIEPSAQPPSQESS